MNFQVPQFIEVEDKIFGPLTFKQFVYLAGGAGLAFLEWVWIPFRPLALLFILPTLGFAAALAFYKIHSRPLIMVLEAAFRYFLNHKLFIWKRGEAKPQTGPAAARSEARGLNIPKLSGSKLKDLSWSLDVQETIK